MKHKRYKFGADYNTILSSIWLFILILVSRTIKGSEFPERECCDPPPIYPPVPNNIDNNVDLPIEQILPTISTSLDGSTHQPIIGRSGKKSCYSTLLDYI